MITTQHITVWNPATLQLSQASDVPRGDTLRTIEALAGKAEAREFQERVVHDEPDRVAPYVSSSGCVVVIFTQKSVQDEWNHIDSEPARGVAHPAEPRAESGSINALNRQCETCGKVSTAAGIAIHQKASGHVGIRRLDAAVA